MPESSKASRERTKPYHTTDLFAEPTGNLSREKLMSTLSEGLAIAESGVQLYEVCLARSHNIDLRNQLISHLAEIRDTTENLGQVIIQLGGNPVKISQPAFIEQQRADFLFRLQIPADLQEIADIENLYFSEVQIQHIFHLLDRLLPFLADTEAKGAIHALLRKNESQQQERLDWMQEYVLRMKLQHLLHMPRKKKSA